MRSTWGLHEDTTALFGRKKSQKPVESSLGGPLYRTQLEQLDKQSTIKRRSALLCSVISDLSTKLELRLRCCCCRFGGLHHKHRVPITQGDLKGLDVLKPGCEFEVSSTHQKPLPFVRRSPELAEAATCEM